jgi:glycosyltransferase involved in cell wall biosynthesis
VLINPKVSIIIPTHNRLAFLREAVFSVLAQTLTDWELIVVDDGSTDGSVTWLNGLGDVRIRVVQEPHTANPSRLRNIGLRHARARWVAFLDSDDRWHPEKLETQLSLHKANAQFQWSYTGYRMVDSTGAVLGRPKRATLPLPESGWILDAEVRLEADITTPAVMAARDFLRSAGGFDESFTWGEDHELWFRLAERGQCGVITTAMVDVRRHGQSQEPRPERSLAFRRIYRDFAQRTENRSLRAYARLHEAYRCVEAARLFAASDQWSEARAAILHAFRIKPLSRFVYVAALRIVRSRFSPRGSRM